MLPMPFYTHIRQEFKNFTPSLFIQLTLTTFIISAPDPHEYVNTPFNKEEKKQKKKNNHMDGNKVEHRDVPSQGQ